MTLMAFGPEMVIYDDGTLARNASLTVVLRDTFTNANVYADDSATPLPNPVVTDGDGNVLFYADDSEEYDILFGDARVHIAPRQPGPQGEPSTVPGPQGPPGPKGPTGDPGNVSFVHDQAVPSALWTITHNLAYYPNVTIVDSSGASVVSDVTYVDANTIEIAFVSPFGGKAYLS